jgi:murein DD-endopeptidase MepM/ murein hydrolase activator NlpD
VFGCQSNKLYDGLKKDLAPEKQAKIFNKTSSSNNMNIPLNGMIIVRENETIYSIANKFKVIPKDIIEDNNLSKPYELKPNQILFLRHENIYIVKENDTVEKISKKFAVKKSEIIKLNKLKTPFKLFVGNKILIPLLKDFSVVDLIINEKVYDKKQITKNEYTSKNKKIKNAPVFLWPAKGEVIKNFGRFGKGQHYDGIDIMFGKNKPIYSAYDGTVAFVGSQIKKFGNLIIVKHNQSWVTAYSNLGKYSVKVGDKIKKQQIIAYTPENKKYFHFQLRHNRNPVNPLSYLN